jgi:hypothetical protein
MITQRVRHGIEVPGDDGKPVKHTAKLVSRIFDEELAGMQRDPPPEIDRNAASTLPEARRQAEEMIVQGQHSPI